MAGFSVTTLEPFGIEIDLDLGDNFAPDQIARLRALFVEHRWLLFRNQSITRTIQEGLVRLFGPIAPPEHDVPMVDNHGGEAALGDSELAFHSDLGYAPKPYIALSLYAVDVEAEPAFTRFVDGVRIWRDLPQALRTRIKDLKALNCHAGNSPVRRKRHADPLLPQSVRALVERHPVTAEPLLFVSELETVCIEGLPRDESDALLEELFAHCYGPPQVHEHQWRNGDLVVWDNFALQHGRSRPGPGARVLRRVAAIEQVFGEQFPDANQGHNIANRYISDGASAA